LRIVHTTLVQPVYDSPNNEIFLPTFDSFAFFTFSLDLSNSTPSPFGYGAQAMMPALKFAIGELKVKEKRE